MRCPDCDEDLHPAAVRCPQCGLWLDQVPPQASNDGEALQAESSTESNASGKSILGTLFMIPVYLFFIGYVFAVPYYNFRFAQEHGFFSWLLLGEVAATFEALAWPWDAYKSLSGSGTNEQSLDTGGVFGDWMAKQYDDTWNEYVRYIPGETPPQDPNGVVLDFIATHDNLPATEQPKFRLGTFCYVLVAMAAEAGNPLDEQRILSFVESVDAGKEGWESRLRSGLEALVAEGVFQEGIIDWMYGPITDEVAWLQFNLADRE